jgi:hypothetical protein
MKITGSNAMLRKRTVLMMFMKAVIALFFVAVLLIVIPTSTKAAYIQSKADDNDSATSLQLTFDAPVTAGSLLVLAVRMSGGGTSTVTSPGAVWTRDKHVQSIVSGWTLDVHSAPNVPGGTTTVTCTVSGSADSIRMMVHEYSGMATSSPAHKVASATGTSGTANTGPVTTTIENCTLFCVTATDSDLEGWAAGPGYTLRGDWEAAGEKICSEDRGPVAAGTYSGVMSLNSDTWAAILVAYKPASPGNGPPAPPGDLQILSK